MTRYAIRIGLGLAALALFITTLPNTVQADVGDRHSTGAISGIVVTAGRERVAGAHVRLFRAGHRRHIVARTTTNRDGTFGFRGVPVGRYVAVAAKREVGRGRTRVAVHEDEVSHVHIVIGD